jgi:hypothetical protein
VLRAFQLYNQITDAVFAPLQMLGLPEPQSIPEDYIAAVAMALRLYLRSQPTRSTR